MDETAAKRKPPRNVARFRPALEEVPMISRGPVAAAPAAISVAAVVVLEVMAVVVAGAAVPAL